MMNHYDRLKGPEVLPTVLPRTTGIVDFSKLFRKHRHISREVDGKRSVSGATASSRHPEENGSENSQVLYMAPPKRPRRIDRSLSSISNNSGRRLDGSSDEKEEDETKQAAEEPSWNIIDREIFEWQYVCQTGRPYWWSPESKFLRLKRIPPRLTNEPKSKTWLRSIDDCPKPKTIYGAPRRSLSDSYLTNPNTVHDLAHLVAVQLLSSCFTLPPEHIIGLPLPNYAPFDKSTVSSLPDLGLISSLRMHTHFRYSPSFGHEARNTSPVQLWSGSTDGPSPRSSTPPNASTGLPIPDIGTSGITSRRPRLRRALHTTEVSASEQSLDSESCEYTGPCRNKDDLEHGATATAWHRRGRIHDQNCRRIKGSLRSGEATRRSVDEDRRSSRYRPSQESSREDGDINTSGSYRGVQPSFPPPKTNYRLKPVIRSEPHHVFIQPVKELVVKRWKKLRRRFSGSLHSPLPASRSEDQSCTSGTSGASSPGMSSDAKIRRRRAQERGDIHSTSVDSTTHYNSPDGEYLTPNSGVPFCVDSRNRTPDFQLADPIVAAASFAAETNTASLGGNPIALQPSLASDFSPGIQQPSSALAICGSGHSRLEFSLSSKSTHPTSPHSFSSRRGPGRARRRSMLSEVHTPEEFRSAITANADGDHEPVERGILSVGTIIPISKDEDTPRTPDPRGHTSDTLNISTFPRLLDSDIVAQERPRMTRMSTNGTQMFTPSEDGMELDGLPVGPGKDLWIAKGKTSDSTYLM